MQCILVLGGLVLFVIILWFGYGSWRSHGYTLIEHDEVRFGPVPMLFFGAWALSFLFALRTTIYSILYSKP
ncbi:MAG: hypothetical protein WCD79_19940 [Chthoniobacteraceae bacterium]